MFSFIKLYYSMGLYTDKDLLTFKTAAMITSDQYDGLIKKDTEATTDEN